MADKKISALPAATTPLAGTEVLPVVQAGTTDQVSVANLTAGRAVSALSYSTTAGYQFRATDNTSYELLRVLDGTVNPGAFIKARAATTDVTLFASGSSVAGQRLMIGAESVEDVVRVSKDNVTVSYGNVVIGTANKGIDFSANPNAPGMTSELLNDYEEGTWTPIIGAGAGSITSYTASGKYTKIGRQVTLSSTITVTNNGTGSLFILVSNLPFSTDASVYTTYGHNNTIGGSVSGSTTGTLIYLNKYDGTYPVITGQTLLLTSVYFV